MRDAARRYDEWTEAERPRHPEPPFDEEQFIEQIRHEWSAVAEDWGEEERLQRLEEAAGVASERLLDMARVGPGDAVLDLGTGVGEPAATAAGRVAPGGHVVGVDLSPRMVEIGRRRLDRLGVTGVELRVGDAGRPDFPPETFDAAVSRWVLMLVPDLVGALGRIRDVLVPGGRLAVGLWGHPSRVPMISLALGVAAELFPMPPQPPDAPTHLWDRGADGFAELLEEAGYADVEADAVDTVFEFADAEDYVEFVTTMAGPLRVVSDSLAPLQRERLKRAMMDAVAGHAVDGRIRLANETLCVAGRKPS